MFGKSKRAQQMADLKDTVAQTMALAQQSMQAYGGGSQLGEMAAAAGAMTPETITAMTAYRERVGRLNAAGVETPATLRSIVVGETSPLLGGPLAQLELMVEPPGGTPYVVSTDQVLTAPVAQALAPGARITVRVDPADPQCVMVWGTGSGAAVPRAASAPAPAPPAPAAAPDRIAQLEKLQDLRVRGILSDAEFEAQKAKLLAS